MATPDPDLYVAAQNGAVRLAVRALKAFWDRLDLTDPAAVRDALERFWPVLVAQFGDVTATLALDRFGEITGLPGVLADQAPAESLNARMRWGISPLFGGDGPDAAFARLAGLVDELVKQPGRDTLGMSAREHGLQVARVPVGKTCAFCLMLASRGWEDPDEGLALGKAHPDCDCYLAVAGEDTGDYGPESLKDRYDTARDAAGSGSTKKILAAMRELEDIN